MRQWPLCIVEPPLSTGERMSVNDPLQSIDTAQSRRSPAVKLTFNSVLQWP